MTVQQTYGLQDEAVNGPGGAGPDAAALSTVQTAAGKTVCGRGDWGINDPLGLLPTPLGVEVRHGRRLHPGVLSSFHHPPQILAVEHDAPAVPGCDAASQDTLHVEPLQLIEEKSRRLEFSLM